MEKCEYRNIKDLCDDIADSYEYYKLKSRNSTGINIVADYYTIIDIMNYLVKTTDLTLTDIEIYDPEFDENEREYLMYIDEFGDIYCEPINNEYSYLYSDENLTYIHWDSNISIILKNKNLTIVRFSVDTDDEDFYTEENFIDSNICSNVEIVFDIDALLKLIKPTDTEI